MGSSPRKRYDGNRKELFGIKWVNFYIDNILNHSQATKAKKNQLQFSKFYPDKSQIWNLLRA